MATDFGGTQKAAPVGERLRKLLQSYDALIRGSFDAPIASRRVSRLAREEEKQSGHVLWMINELLVQDFDASEADRWLSFIQGVLWVLGLRDIKALRRDNRWLTEVLDEQGA